MNRALIKSLTVGDLIKQLRRYPGNTPVYLSSDEEGNCFGNLDEDSIEKFEDFDGIIIYPGSESVTDIEDLCM